MNKNLILAALALTSTVGFAAGNSATDTTAVAKAKIRKAITIARTADLDFGGLVVSAAAGPSETAIVNAQTGALSLTGGGTVIIGSFNTPAAASFNVGGTKSATYTVTLPSTAVLTGPGASTLTASSFTFWSATASSSASASLDGTAGTDVLRVGATLTIPSGTVDGDYISPAFAVTVAYN